MLDRTPALAELITGLETDKYLAKLAELQELAEADPEQFQRFLYDWSFWGRPAQQEPVECNDPECRCGGRWTVHLILAGRGWGKTRTGSEWVNGLAAKYPGCRIAIVARSAGDARGVMIDGESGILATSPPWLDIDYEPSKLKITWKGTGVGCVRRGENGRIHSPCYCSTAAIFTGEEPDGPRGYQHHFFWADEIAAWEKPEETWANLLFGHRLVKRVGWPEFRLRGLVTTTPKATDFIWSFVRSKKEFDADEKPLRPKHVHITKGATYDNAANLGPEFFDQIVSEYENTRLGEQELEGKILEDVPGALWKPEFIDSFRVNPEQLPDQHTCVVAVDPATTDKEDSDNTGIVVVAAGPKPGIVDPDFKPVDPDADNSNETLAQQVRRMNALHGYVLEDASLKASPGVWAKKAIRMYHKYGASCIVAEANQGGDMVRHTIHSEDPTVPVRLVKAKENKKTRAAPVVALYEQGRIHHVNPRRFLKELEKELLEWDPALKKSPDRLDAMVWGFTHLLVKKRIFFAAAPISVGERVNPWASDMPLADPYE